MNNLKKFATEADYTAATLNYPAVSWVTATDNVYFDKSGSTPTVNDKVMIASYDGSGDSKFIFYNCEASTSSDITSITLDDVAVEPITCQTEYGYDAGQVYIAKYTLNVTSIGDWCSGDLGCSDASTPANIDVLIPSQVTVIDKLPSGAVNLVIEAITPPQLSLDTSDVSMLQGIYVPTESVSAYQTEWSNFGSYIHSISDYQGNLPV